MKKVKNNNTFLTGNDPDVQAGLNRLSSYDQDIDYSTYQQASPYRYGGALYGTDTDELSTDYIGRPIKEDISETDAEYLKQMDEHGSFIDSWRLFNKRQTQSDLTAARLDLQSIEIQRGDLLFAKDLMSSILQLKEVTNQYKNTDDERLKETLSKLIQLLQDNINKGYQKIQSQGRYSDMLRTLFFDTTKDTDGVLLDIIKYNSILDREALKDAANAEDQIINGWKKNTASDLGSGLLKYAWATAENIFGIVKNAFVSGSRGIGAILPTWAGGTDKHYNPFVDEAIRESDQNDKRYDKFIISGSEFLNDPNKVNRFNLNLSFFDDQLDQLEFEKAKDISDLQYKYTNGSWYFNPKAIDPVFEKLQGIYDGGLTGIITHPYYSFPELGSSFSDIKHFATLMATDLTLNAITSDKVMSYITKKAATGAMGGWYGKFLSLLAGGMDAAEAIQNIRILAATGETAANIYLTEQMRKNETKLEVFDAYNERMTKDLIDAGVDINKVIEAGNRMSEHIGVTIPDDPAEQFKNALLFDIDIDDPQYKKIVDRNKVGLNKIYNENLTLAAKDFIEGFAFMPYAGKAMLSAFYRSVGRAENKLALQTLQYQAGRKTSEKLEQLVKNGTASAKDKADYYINKFIDNQLGRAFSNPATRVALTRPGKYIKAKAKQIAAIAPLEGIEEGQQQLLQLRYSRGEYDNYNKQQLDFDISSLFADQLLGTEALSAYLGSYFGDPTKDELEMRRAMNIGFTTALWFGAPHVLTNAFKSNELNIRNLVAQLKTDLTLKKYVADTWARQEDDHKIGMLFDRYQKAGINAQRVIDSMEQMKKYKGGIQGELVTDEYISDDQKLASLTYNMFKSSIVDGFRTDQNIAKGSAEHKMLVQTAVREIHDYENVLEKYQGNTKKIEEEKNKILSEIAQQIKASLIEDPNDSSKQTISTNSKYYTFLNKVLNDYNKLKKAQEEAKKIYNDPKKNRRLLKEAEERILGVRKKLLQKAGIEITDEVWNLEKEQAKNFAPEHVKKYLFDEYTEDEKKQGYKSMTDVGSFEEYTSGIIGLLISALRLFVYKKLIDELSVKSEQMKFIHSELGSDINVDSISYLIDALKDEYNNLKELAKKVVSDRNIMIDRQNAAISVINEIERAAGKKRGFLKKKKRYKSYDQVLSEFGEFGDITELLRAQGLQAVNSALLNTLAPRVSVFTTGYANPLDLHTTTRSRKWTELTESLREEYRKKVKEDALKEGKQQPSEKSISSKYNYEQRQKHINLEKIKNEFKRKLVNTSPDLNKTLDEIDNEDLLQLSKDAARAYVQEVLNERIDNYEERKKIYHLSYHDPVTRLVEDNSVQTQGDNTDTSVLTEGDNTTPELPIVDASNPQNNSEMSPEMRRILGLDRQGESQQEADVANMLGEHGPVDINQANTDTNQDTTQDDTANKNTQNSAELPDNNTLDVFNDNENEGYSEPEPSKEDGLQDDQERPNNKKKDGPSVESETPSEYDDESSENDNKDDEDIESESSNEEQSIESVSKNEEQPIESISNFENEDSVESLVYPNEEEPVESTNPDHDDNTYNDADIEHQYDEGSRHPHGRNTPKHPRDVESHDEAIADYLSSTFFYSVTPGIRETPVSLSVGEDVLQTTYPIHSAKELSEKLTDKNWIYSCECYYICSGNLGKKGSKNKDAVTVSLVIDDHNAKATYTAFLRTPGNYKYGPSTNQMMRGEELITDSLYMIGLDPEKGAYTVDENGKKHLNVQAKNEKLEIALRQKYEMSTGILDPEHDSSLNDEQKKAKSKKFLKDAWLWYTSQNLDVKDEIEDQAHLYLRKDGKRILKQSEIREQLARLRAARNAIIDAYCEIDEKGNIIIPKTIKKTVRPSKSNISVSNGVFNNQKDSTGKPVLRNLTEVKHLSLSTNTEELTEAMEDGALIFGFGRGKWGNNPYAISSVTDPSVDFNAGPNAGKSGAIYLMVDIGNNKRVPVQLIPQKFQDQEREDGSWHFVNRSGDTLDLCIDPISGKINTVLDDGIAVKPSLAEIILFMVCGKLNVENLPNQDPRLNQAILDLIVNTGEHTLMDPDSRIQNDIKQLSTKLISIVETPDANGNIKRKLVLGVRLDDETVAQKAIDIDEIFDPTNDILRKEIVYQIKENLHWNTEVASANEKDRSIAMTDQFPILLLNFLLNYFEQNPNAVEYKFCGLNKVSFKKSDLFNVVDGLLEPKNCNILSWMITNGHIQTDLGDTVFKDPFIFAQGIEQSSAPTQSPNSKVPGGNSVVTTNATNQAAQKTRTSSEKIDRLSKQKQFGINQAVNKQSIKEAVAATEEERKLLLESMDGIFDVIALSAELKLGKDAIETYTESIKNSILEYIDFINDSNALGKKLDISNVDFSIINKLALLKVASQGFTPVLHVQTNGSMSIQFLLTSHIINQGKRITGVFSKVEAGAELTDEEARTFLSDMLGIDGRQVILLDHLYDIETGEEVFGVTEAIADIFTGNPSGVIMLSRSNKFGSTFHEAFHYANLILNKRSERLALYRYFVEHYRKDLKHAKLELIEEQLAIMFQEYMDKSLDKSLTGRIKRFFKTLWDIINIFSRKNDLVKQTFEMLKHGGYKTKGIDKESLSELKRVYDKNVKNNIHIPGLRRSVTEKLPTEINSARTFYDVATAMANRFLAEHIILKPQDLKAFKGTPYNDFMNQMKELAKAETDPVKRTLINAVANNPDAFLDIICRMFDEYGVKVRFGKKKIDPKNDLDIKNDITDGQGEKSKPEKGLAGQNDFVYDIENLSLSKKDNAAFRAKLFLGLIEERTFTNDVITQERITVPVLDKLLGFPTYKPFSESWNKILQDCWQCETYDELDTKSKDPNNPYAKTSFRYEVRFRSKSDAFYAALDEKLDKCYHLDENLELVPDIELQNQILSTIKSSYPKLGYSKIETSKKTQMKYDNPEQQDMSDDTTVSNVSAIPSDIEKDFTIFSDNAFRSKRMLPRQWSKLAIVSGLVKYKTTNNGNVVLSIDKEYVDRILSKFKHIEDLLLTSESGKNTSVQRRKISNESDAETIYNDVIYRISDLMSEIGIAADVHTLEYLILTSNSKAETSYVERCKELQSIVMKSTGSLGYFIHNVILPNVGKEEISYSTINKDGKNGRRKTTPIDEMYYGYSDDAFITKYALSFSAVHPSSQDFSTQSPDNKKLYPIGDNNYITDTMRRANYDIDDFVAMRSKCPYQKHSIFMDIARQIKRTGFKKQDMLELMAFVGLKDADQNDGVDYFGMTRLEDFVSKMVLMFGDISEQLDGSKRLINRAMILPTMADKKTYYAIRSRLLDALMCDDIITNTMSSENGEMNARRFSNGTLSLFHNYFLDELSTIEQYYSRKNMEYLAKHPGKLRKNYHGRRTNIGTKENPIWTVDFGGNGGLFRYCYDFFKDPETGLNLNQMIEAKFRIQKANQNGNLSFREGLNEIDGFENVRAYLSEIRQKYATFNNDIAGHINNHLVNQVDNQLTKINNSSDMRIVEIAKGEDGKPVYKPTKIPRAILQYYMDRIQKAKGSTFRALAYGFSGELGSEAAYCAMANHYVNNVISMIEYEKNFSGDQAQYKWKYFGKKQKVTVDGVQVEIKTLKDKNVDRVKRLGAGLSPGKNIRCQYSQEILEKYPELSSDKFTNAYMSDIESISSYIDEIKTKFKADRIGELLRSLKDTDKELIDKILESSGISDIEEFIHGLYYNKQHNNKSYYDIAKESIDKYNSDLTTTIDEEVARQANPYERINVSDAQVLIRPALYRKIRIGLGEWSFDEDETGYSDEKAFLILEKNDSWMTDPEKNKIVRHLQLYPLKMTYFDTNPELESPGNYLGISRYNKLAIFPLFKYIATSETGSLLYERMNREGNEIDMLTFDSAVKVGANQMEPSAIVGNRDLSKIDESLLRDSDQALTKAGAEVTKESNSGLDSVPVLIQYLSRLLKQLNTEAHTDEERAIGTQMFKIAFSDIINTAMYACDEEGNGGRSGREIRSEIMACIDALTERGRQAICLKYLQDNGLPIKDAQTKFIKDIIKSNDLGSMSLDIINGKGCVSSLSSRTVFEQSTSKKVNANVVEIHTKGGAAVQQSIFGFVGFNNNAVESYTGNYTMFNEGKALQWSREDGSMEVILSMNFFKAVVPNQYQDTYEHMRQWLIDHDVIKGLKSRGYLNGDEKVYSNPKPFGVGYRIPTQGMSSMFAFTVADVLPEQSGDLIIVPEEFTAQTGSDFDVDKLFLATMSYNKGDQESTLETSDIFEKSVGKTVVGKMLAFKDDSVSEGAIQNRLLQNYIDIISDRKNFALSRASIDVFTGIITEDIVPKLVDGTEAYVDGMYELSPMYLSERKMEFTTGKDGIAPFALNITNHALTQFTDLCMDYGDNVYNLGKLNAITGQDGRHVLGWLSAMVNAHVDVAKDPYIFTLNVNGVTYNMTNFLIRAGKANATFSFIAQPILKEYANRLNSEGGYYGNNDGTIDNNASLEKKKKKIQGGLALKYYNAMIVNYKRRRDSLTKEEQEKWDKEISNIKITRTGAIDVSKCEHKADVLSVEKDKTEHMLNCARKGSDVDIFEKCYYQLLTLKAFLSLSKYADEMSSLVMNSRIDTKKFGNTIADQLNFLNNYNIFRYNTPSKDAVYWYIDKGEDKAKHKETMKKIKESNNPREAVQYYFSHTFLDYKLQQATALNRKMLYGQSFTASDTFRDTFINVMGMLYGEEIIEDPNYMSIDPTTNSPIYSRKGYSKVYKKLSVTAIATAIENIFRAKCLINSKNYWNSQDDYSGHIDFTFSGDKLELFKNIISLLYGDPTAEPGSREALPLFHRISNFIKALLDVSDSQEYKNMSHGLVDTSTGKITNEFLNFLNPIPPTKKYPQGRLLLKENQFDRSSIRKDVLSASYNDLLSHPHPSVRRLAREIAIYAYYTSYDQNTRDAFFELVPPYYREQYDEAVSRTVQGEKAMKSALNIISDYAESGKTVDEKYEDVMDVIARNYWYNHDIIPHTVETTTLGRPMDAYELGNEDHGLVKVRYKNQSKRAINTYGIIISDTHHGDYFTVTHDNDTYLYKKVGTIDVTKSLNTEAHPDQFKNSVTHHNVYFIIPKLGRHTGKQHQYELINTSEDASVYNENDLPTQFNYDNLMMSLLKWVNNPSREFKQFTNKKTKVTTQSATAEFRPNRHTPIKGQYEQYSFSGDNYINNDGTVRFLLQLNPAEFIMKKSAVVLNFGLNLDDKVRLSNVIDIPANSTAKQISSTIRKFFKEHNINAQSKITIGLIGESLNIKINKKELQSFIDACYNDKSKELYQNESLSKELIEEHLDLYKKFLESNAETEMIKRKRVQVFGKVLQDLITDGYSITTTYSHGLSITDLSFINASRILSDYLSYRQSYVVLPKSWSNVKHLDDYESVAAIYDETPEYITDPIKELQEMDVEEGVKQATEQIVKEQQVEQESAPSEQNNTDTEQSLESSNSNESEDVVSEVVEDASAVLNALGLDLGQTKLKITEENKKPSADSSNGSEEHKNC